MLNTDFLGMKLKNPIIVAAGPWNRDGKALRKSIASGAGAVVTESIVSDTVRRRGGSVGVAARQGGGTVFTVRLPLYRVEEA